MSKKKNWLKGLFLENYRGREPNRALRTCFSGVCVFNNGEEPPESQYRKARPFVVVYYFPLAVLNQLYTAALLHFHLEVTQSRSISFFLTVLIHYNFTEHNISFFSTISI